MRALASIGLFLVAASSASIFAACSKADSVESDEPTGDAGRKTGTPTGDGGVTVVAVPGPPGSDSGTTTPVVSDGGIQGPAFDLTTLASLQGTFITDQTPISEVPSGATVTWSFKIDGIVDATQAVTTAKWTAQATNATGGNLADFPSDTNLELSLTRTGASTDPRVGTWEFYGNQQSPYSYVLVKVEAGRIVDFHYYKRLLDDSEFNPADKPRNVTYTATNK